MSKKKDNSKIKCSVESCKNNNCEEGTCTLNEISVNCTCDNKDCCCCDETVCESFETDESSNKNITDNVYEVKSEQSELDDDEVMDTELDEDDTLVDDE